MVDRDPFDQHVKHVKALEAVGIPPPPDWAKVHVRLNDFLRLKTLARDRLIDAIAEGDGDVVALRTPTPRPRSRQRLIARLSVPCTTSCCSSTAGTPARTTRNSPSSSTLPQRN